MFSIRCIESTIRIMLPAAFLLVLTPLSADDKHGHANQLPNMFTSTNARGKDATYSTAGFIDLNNPFLKTWEQRTQLCFMPYPFARMDYHPRGVQAIFDKQLDWVPFFVW